jgi:D-3-phosphoglycerate dehydrogenase
VYKVVQIDAARYPPTVEPGILAEAGAELLAVQCHSPEEVIQATREADGVLVSLTRITRPIIESWTRMKVIARLGVGYDTVDLDAATERGILVTNVPDFCTEEVADTAFGLILALERKLVLMDQLVRQGVYNRMSAQPLRRLRNTTLGIVGLGRIGKSVARRAIPFGYRLLACDPYLDPQAFCHYPVEFVSLETLLRESRVVSLHVPLTEETFQLIGEKQLGWMPPEALLINAARGAVVDQKALFQALVNGKIRGAGLDVLEKEPPDPADPLLKLPNLLITPHYGSYSEEAYEEVREKAARQVGMALKGENPTYLVNPAVLGRYPHSGR